MYVDIDVPMEDIVNDLPSTFQADTEADAMYEEELNCMLMNHGFEDKGDVADAENNVANANNDVADDEEDAMSIANDKEFAKANDPYLAVHDADPQLPKTDAFLNPFVQIVHSLPPDGLMHMPRIPPPANGPDGLPTGSCKLQDYQDAVHNTSP